MNSIFNSDGFLNGINILFHADDALILATSHEKLKNKMYVLDAKLTDMSLKMNYKKCKLMCFGNTLN